MKVYFLYHHFPSNKSASDVRAIYSHEFDGIPTASQQQAALESHLRETGRKLSRRHVEISTLEFAATATGFFPEGTSRERCARIRKALRDIQKSRRSSMGQALKQAIQRRQENA